LKKEVEQSKWQRMGKVYNILQMWQGILNLQATEGILRLNYIINGSGPSLQVQVQVQTKPLPNY
jgi:hypothetical protein